MKVFLIERNPSYVDYDQCLRAVVVGDDAKHAERCARWNIRDWKKCKLTVTPLEDLEEGIVMKQYKGWWY